MTAGREAGEDGRATSNVITTEEEPVLAADRVRFDRAFGQIVVDRDRVVGGINVQGCPLLTRIRVRFPPKDFRAAPSWPVDRASPSVTRATAHTDMCILRLVRHAAGKFCGRSGEIFTGTLLTDFDSVESFEMPPNFTPFILCMRSRRRSFRGVPA